MYHYYYDGPGGAPAGGQPPQAVEEKELPVQAEPEPEQAVKRRPRKNRSERGAAAVLLGMTLVLGVLAVVLALQAKPVDVSAWLPSEDYGESTNPQTVIVDLELERYPNWGGTTLTLVDRPGTEPLSFQEIYQQVSPSVVSITALLPMGSSQGTGVVMTADGYIITNAHVIEGAFRADVSLEDGRSFQAKLVGSDKITDLAVLKVEGSGLPTAVFGDSDLMEVGDTVVAIGNPMGEELRGTMTDGILSAIDRDMEVEGDWMTLLQTTAALNTGNSGGALVNDKGQVIGITNMKLVDRSFDGATIEGLGFAIPTATVKPVVDALIAQGYVSGRPTLGVTVRWLYPQEMEQFRVDHGLLVIQLEPGSDAAGKLETGDILLSANGTALSTSDDLLAIRDGLEAGDTIALEIQRDGEVLQTEIAVMERYQLDEALS